MGTMTENELESAKRAAVRYLPCTTAEPHAWRTKWHTNGQKAKVCMRCGIESLDKKPTGKAGA